MGIFQSKPIVLAPGSLGIGVDLDFTLPENEIPETIRGYMIVCSQASALDTNAAQMRLSTGVGDLTNERCRSHQVRDNFTPTRAHTTGDDGESVMLVNASGTIISSASFTSTISSGGLKGIRLTTTRIWNSVVFTMVVFSGDDLTVDVGTVITQIAQNGVTSVNIGGSADAAIFFGRAGDAGSGNPDHKSSIGFWRGVDDAQFGVQWFEEQNGPVGSPVMSVINDGVMENIDETSPATRARFEVVQDADGFNVFTRDTAAFPEAMAYIAFRVSGGSTIEIGQDLTATSTGTDAITGVGHKPQSGIVVVASATALNTEYDTVQAAESLSFGMFGPEVADQVCYALTVDSAGGVGNSEANSFVTESSLVKLRNANLSGDLDEADLDSLDSDGFTLNYGTADATGRLLLYMTFENQVQSVSPTGIGSSFSAGAHTVAPQAVAVSPPGIASSFVGGAHQVDPQVVAVSPPGIASSFSAGTPTLAAGALQISPGGIPTNFAAGTPTLNAVQSLSPAGVGSSFVAGTPTINAVQQVSPTGVGTSFVAGTHVVAPVQQVSPGGIPSSFAAGAHTFNAVQQVSPGGIVSSFVGGTHVINAVQQLVPTGIPSSFAAGTHVFNVEQAVSPGGIPSSFAAGAHTVELLLTLVSPTGIPSSFTPGSHALSTGTAVAPTGIASSFVAGSHTLAPGQVQLSPGGIASSFVGGAHQVDPVIAVSPGGIPSAFAAGVHEINAVQQVVPGGIPSSFAAGTPTLTQGAQVLPPGIPSNFAAGAHTLAPQAVQVSPTGIPSSFAAGGHALQQGQVLLPAGIPSSFAAGSHELAQAFLQQLSPGGIPSSFAAGVHLLQLAALQQVSPTGIPTSFAAGVHLVTQSIQTISPPGLPSSFRTGIPFLRGGALPLPGGTAIQRALLLRAKLGTFVGVDHCRDDCIPQPGLQVQPMSIETNDVSAVFNDEDRYGRSIKQDRVQWRWQLILDFCEEVSPDLFEQTLLDDPIKVLRDPAQGLNRQATLKLIDASYTHPPRIGASNGTRIVYHFNAELSPI